MHTCAHINHTLLISPQFRTLAMAVWPSLCFVQQHSLMMGHWGPKPVGATRRRVTPRVWETIWSLPRFTVIYAVLAVSVVQLCSAFWWHLATCTAFCIYFQFVELHRSSTSTNESLFRHINTCNCTDLPLTGSVCCCSMATRCKHWMYDRCHCTNYESCHKAVWVLLRKGSGNG
jgi:hypothetical protein